ncbi:MAG: hypothetical protein IIC69_01550 [Nanoarchaeota archaeon]|nr:hypothetical protein [Nanoarchaeota archaeon]
MNQPKWYNNEMQVRGTNLKVRVESSSSPSEPDILIVTDGLDNVVRRIAPFDRREKIEGIYPLTIGAEGPVVGYAEHTGVVKVDTYSEIAHYDLLTGQVVLEEVR